MEVIAFCKEKLTLQSARIMSPGIPFPIGIEQNTHKTPCATKIEEREWITPSRFY